MARMVVALAALALALGCSGTTPGATPALDVAAGDSATKFGDLGKTDGPADATAPADATQPADTVSDVDGGLEADAPPALTDVVPSADVAPPQEVASALDAAADDAPASDLAAADVAPQGDTAGPPPPLFDMDLIGNAATAQCTFSNQHMVVKDGVPLTAWDLTYMSWESIDGVLKPIKIKAFAARPGSAQILPGVIAAHGLGGYADESNATGPAALLGMFVVAYTGPGGGTDATNTSEGFPASYQNGYRMFDVLKDTRGSWFWGHAVAAMRGVTCLQQRPDVFQDKLGITGFSAGGVISTLVAGHDPRISAAVPLSGVLAWSKAVEAPKAWQHLLLQKAGLSVTSPEWLKLQTDLIDPGPALQGTQAKIFMINGSSDEFFPLTAHLATYNAVPGSDKRTAIVANFDHGCYELGLAESKQNVKDRADLYANGGQRAWFRHWFATDPNYAYFPAAPVVSVTVQGGLTLVAAQVDPGGSKLSIDAVRVWGSNNSDLVWANNTLDCKGGACSKLLPVALDATASWYVDVIYKTGGLLPEKFAVSSLPVLAQNLVPDMLCAPPP